MPGLPVHQKLLEPTQIHVHCMNFPILLFSSISLHWLLRKSFLSFLAILWNSAFKWMYLSFSPLPLASLLFLAICKVLSDNYFAFLHFFFLGMLLIIQFSSVQSSSVTQLCLTLCYPMDCSMPILPVHHQFLEFTQTHVHWVSDAMQPSHPLSSPSPSVLNLSQHQGL